MKRLGFVVFSHPHNRKNSFGRVEYLFSMQTQSLSQLKQQIVLLDPNSKKELADFLAHELDSDAPNVSNQAEVDWLKDNRAAYQNRYVASVGGDLVADGQTFAAAKDAVAERGFPDAFITYVFAADAEPFGGW